MSRRLAVVAAAAALLLALDLFAFASGAEHYGGFWNDLPLGDLALGLLGATLLVEIGARVLKPLLARAEDHYREP